MKKLLLSTFVLFSALCQSGCISENRNISDQDTLVADTALYSENAVVDTTTEGNKETFAEVKRDREKQIKSLKPFFKFSKDEFSNTTWVKSKNEPRYRNSNALFCYFSEENDQARNLRFVLQYNSDDWLFIENYVFAIDGETFTFIPAKVESDNGSGEIWEWSDDYVSPELATILKKVVSSKSAKIKMNGSKYFDVKIVSQKQKTDIKRTLQLYKEMQGNQLIGY